MDKVQLRDHAFLMLKVIANDIGTPQSALEGSEKSKGRGPRRKKDTAAERHAVGRLQAGYTIDQLVSEYRALRFSVLNLWSKAEHNYLPTDRTDVTRFNESIDQALAESVVRIANDVKENDRQRLQAILEVVPVGIMMANSTGKLVLTNPESRCIWGDFPVSESLAEYSEWKAWWADRSERHGQAVEAHEWPLARALRSEEASSAMFEIEPFGLPGQRQKAPYEIIEIDSFDVPSVHRTVYSSAVPIRNAQGSVSGAVVTLMDITDRVKAEQDASDRQVFQLELSDRIRPLADPDEITDIAGEMLAKQLNAARVDYAEIGSAGETVSFKRGWARDRMALPDATKLRLDVFGSLMTEALRAGRTFAVSDVLSGERSSLYFSACAANGVRSVLAIPLMKGGQLRGLLTTYHSSVHQWTDAEIALAQDVMDRTWSAVERARAEAELRREHAQSHYIFDSMTEGFALLDHNWTVLQMNAAGLRISGLAASDVIGRNHWEIWPELKGTDTERLYRGVKETNIASRPSSRPGSTASRKQAAPSGIQQTGL